MMLCASKAGIQQGFNLNKSKVSESAKLQKKFQYEVISISRYPIIIRQIDKINNNRHKASSNYCIREDETPVI